MIRVTRKSFFLFVLAAILLGGDVCAASSPARKSEIKLYVTPANTEQALQALKLDERRAKQRTVCFFDTSERLLEDNHLILRARQSKKGHTDSTIKLRADGDTIELSDRELAIQPEQDWTNENTPAHSRALGFEFPAAGLLSEVVAGQLEASDLFGEEQKALVKGRVKDLNWAELRLYGPAEVKVWKLEWKFEGFQEDVTVELWNLQKDGKVLDILEVSAKVKAETDEQAKDMARQFFAAARASGMGEPAGLTKTRMVLDFFQPGASQ